MLTVARGVGVQASELAFTAAHAAAAQTSMPNLANSEAVSKRGNPMMPE